MNRLIRAAAVVIGVAAVALWFRYGQPSEDAPSSSPPDVDVGKEVGKEVDEDIDANGFRRLTATLVDHKHNDGDSFHVTTNGKQYEFRLYFVDAPETRFKSYRDGNNNGYRLEKQAEYFGQASGDDAAAIGRAAKQATAKLLAKPFVVYTTFEEVFSSERYYAFVKPAGKSVFLSELLVRSGLARIYTKGIDGPDGVKRSARKRDLRRLEADAKAARLGGWR